MKLNHAALGCACAVLAACNTKTIEPSATHILQTPDTAKHSSGVIPQTSKNAVVLPPPAPVKKVETYSVVVTHLPAREILFALARDAKLNIDIHPGLEGEVTLNAINQTLPQILDRISKQVEMRYEMRGDNLVVMPDTPFLKSYKIDYVNMSRDAEGGISNTSQIGGAGGNGSKLAITNTSKNHFWITLQKNIEDILKETDKQVLTAKQDCQSVENAAAQNADTLNTPPPDVAADTRTSIGANNTGVSRNQSKQEESKRNSDCQNYTYKEAASVIPNPEAGIITVRATGRQHEKIQEFITHVMRNARRQVLIEATIAEVRLSSNYQQGINWSKLVPAGTKGISVGSAGTALRPDSLTATAGALILNYTDPASKFGSLAGSVSLLETFGDVKVLSSPKLSVLNNQTAMLRVIDNNVYFIVNSTVSPCSPKPCTDTIAYTTTVNTVSVGFSMSITPQINENDTVLLNVRPTITTRLDDATDPTPGIGTTATPNKIPQISTREMESILKLENNQIAILGGLMQDEINKQTDSLPLLSNLPFAGNAFKNRNDTKTKTELVIFLRPVVIKDASLEGDYSAYKNTLPDANFLKSEDEKTTQ